MSLENFPNFLLNFSECEMNGEENHFYQFKSFRLNVGERQLLHNNSPVSLTPKAFDVLSVLVTRSGHLVEKEELLRLVWADSFVEEANIPRIVHTLRKTLGEDENGNKFIETVAKKGYRFTAEVTEISESESPDSKSEDVQSQFFEPTNAFQAYQLAQYYFQRVTAPDLVKARNWLEQAVRYDAAFAPAHAALAEVAVMEVIIGLNPPFENLPKAKASLWRAAELSSDSIEFYSAAGIIALFCDRNFIEAERNLRKTLELNAHYAFANKYLGEALMYQCRLDEAEFYLRRAVEIEPMDFHHQIVLLIHTFFTRNYQKLIEECDKLLDIYPHLVVAGWMRCWGLEQTGKAAEAVAEYKEILTKPGGELAWRWIGYAYALAGDRENALEVSARLEAESREHYLSPTYQALLHAALNETDKAFSYLKKSLTDHDPWILWTAVDPRFDNLRPDPRFNDLIRRIGFQNAADEREIRASNPSKAAPLKNSELEKADSRAIFENDSNSQSAFRIPQSKARIILFVVGFLSAVLLMVLLSFNLPSESSVNPHEVKSIAILPLNPLAAEKRDALYELGIADSLILTLSRVKNLTVRSLSATQGYTDTKKDAVAIGREQKVDYVFASNYQIADGKIRITSQLINVSTGAVEEVFKDEQTISNAFAVQDAFAANVGQKLLTRLNRSPNDVAAVKRYTTSEDAYRLYLQGRFLVDKRSRKDAEKAIEYLEQAVKIDPNYALAYAVLANARIAAGNFGSDDLEQYAKAKAAMEKALAIDDNLAEAHASAGEVKFMEWDFAGAEREFRRAVELNPNSAAAHQIYAIYLNSMGRFDEAIAATTTAIDIEPTSVLNHRDYGMILFFARRPDEAAVVLERAIEMDAGFRTAYGWLIRAYIMKGDDDKAFEWFLRAPHRKEESAEKIELWKTLYAQSGWRGINQQRIEDAKQREKQKEGKMPHLEMMQLYADLGDKEQAIIHLEKAFQLRPRGVGLTWLKADPRFDSIRDDPRFQEIVRRVGLK